MDDKKKRRKIFNNKQNMNRFTFWMYMIISNFVTFSVSLISIYVTDNVMNWTVMMLLMASCSVSTSFLLLMSGEYKNVLKEYDINRIVKVSLLVLIKVMTLFLVLALFVSTYLGNAYIELMSIGVFLDLVLCTTISIMARKSIIRLYGKYKLSKGYL